MLFRIYLLSFLLHFTSSRVNKHLKMTCGLDEVSRDSIAMTFYVEIVNTGTDCLVDCIPGRCCSEQGNEENCDVIKLFGGYQQNIPAGENRTVRFAAPLVNPYERRGYCIVHINSKVNDQHIYRDSVIIPFDTGRPSDVPPCAGVDQDAFNNCQPVDCDTYYNGHKPHFSRRLKRCLAAPQCSEDDIYDEDSNTCIKSITDNDIKEIDSISKMRKKHTFKNTIKSLDKNIKFNNTKKVNENYENNKFLDCLRSPKILILVMCCFVFILTYYVRNRCHGDKKEKELLTKHFNKKDSISTPLLSDSLGTATTCQMLSESSSNIDKRIKFYKACQDKRAKASMSDDILSRCLKRRDWTANPKTSDIIQKPKLEDLGMEYEMEDISDRASKESLSTKTSLEKVNYDSHNFYTKYVTALKKTHSLSENYANECLSKESIEFLSERGLTQSKLDISSTGTSKNNLQAVLSLLSHKVGQFSDPNPDLELLHMSRASMFSSDASDCDSDGVRKSGCSF